MGYSLAEQGVRNFILGEYGYANYSNLFDQYGEGVGVSAKRKIEPRAHIRHQPNLDYLGSADSQKLNVEYYDVLVRSLSYREITSSISIRTTLSRGTKKKGQ